MRGMKEFVDEDILKNGKYGGFARIPSCWQHLPMSNGTYKVLAACVQFSPINKPFTQGFRTIAKAARVSVPTAQSAVKWLMEYGLLTKLKEGEDGKAHTYMLHYYEVTCTALAYSDQLPDDVDVDVD